MHPRLSETTYLLNPDAVKGGKLENLHSCLYSAGTFSRNCTAQCLIEKHDHAQVTSPF